MNQKITFPELVNALADATQSSKRISEEFLKELFSLIASALTSGETVKIKRIGTFKITDVDSRKSINVSTGEQFIIPTHRKISFTPDKELAEAVNAPFSAFETVELSDDITDEMLNGPLPTHEDYSSSNINSQSVPEPIVELPQIQWDETIDSDGQVETIGKKSETPEVQSVTNTQELPDSIADLNSKSEDAVSDIEYSEANKITSETTEASSPSDYDTIETDENIYSSDEQVAEPYSDTPKSRKSFISGYIWGLISTLIVIAAVGVTIYFLYPSIFTKSIPLTSQQPTLQSENIITTPDSLSQDSLITSESQAITENTSSDTQQEATPVVNTQPSDLPTYDTISRTRFLTTMAKEHYGNYNLWPYIYQENKHILGHPDRIKPGTKVVIPPMSKYDINPNDKQCIEKAKRMGVEIYNRYKKK